MNLSDFESLDSHGQKSIRHDKNIGPLCHQFLPDCRSSVVPQKLHLRSVIVDFIYSLQPVWLPHERGTVLAEISSNN